MKMTTTQYTRVIHVLLAMMWPFTATAAVSFIDSFHGYTPGILGILFFISTLAGLTALVLGMDRELRRTGKLPPYYGVYIVAHLLASWLGGVLAVFVGEAGEVQSWTLLTLVLAFSFGGVKVLERSLEKYIDQWLPKPPPTSE